jgi:hypothetical protein
MHSLVINNNNNNNNNNNINNNSHAHITCPGSTEGVFGGKFMSVFSLLSRCCELRESESISAVLVVDKVKGGATRGVEGRKVERMDMRGSGSGGGERT